MWMRARTVGYAVAAVALAAAGVGLWYGGMWYAHQQMKMDMPGMGKDGESGSGMKDMPGMKMEGEQADSSEVEGYVDVKIAPDLQQSLGVKFGEVEQAKLQMSVRAVGIVRPDETKVAHVNLKTEGWVEDLFVNYTGQEVQKGDPLLAIYSPDFLTTQSEYLIARQAKSSSDKTFSLTEAVLRRLELWDVPQDEIDELVRTKEIRKNLTLRSPLTGAVLEKHAFEGQHVGPKDELYVIADLSTVWVQAKVYEYELPHVALDAPAGVTIPALPDEEFNGKVVFIQPTLDEATRTAQVRIELPNPHGRLKPGMFAHIRLTHDMGEALLVPATAIMRTGERDLAFRVDAEDRFVPAEVKISPIKFEERFQVLEGLKAGDKVVTSANFLIDSESRLRAGGGGMAGMPGMGGMDMGDMKGTGTKGMDMPGMKKSKTSDKEGTDRSKKKE
jgi:Cu(I)/Ag(I) efflux system membrane fusion protein